MRPRPFAADNAGECVVRGYPFRASMRPRPFAADNAEIVDGFLWSHDRFNEAAAFRRG